MHLHTPRGVREHVEQRLVQRVVQRGRHTAELCHEARELLQGEREL